jgi:NADP-dependent 3-hydroxy acid dehydrogenase YdfG
MEKVIVVTGASAGIGAAFAQLAGQKGARLVLAARREAELQQVAAQSGPEVLTVVADVTRRADVERIRDQALQRFGHIDVWINNAGRGITRAAADLTDDDIDQTMLINLKAPLYGAQAVLPHMKERGRGHIINVSSMLGRVPIVSVRAAYNAAKHALMSLTANLRMDLRAQYPEIMVSAFLPGVVATDFGLNAMHGGPDSRTLPFAQPVAEVAAALWDLVEKPRAEGFTRPQAHKMIEDYYGAADIGVVEAKFGRP